MPVSYDMFQIGSCYLQGQIYANPNPTIETIYDQQERLEKADYKIKSKRYLHIDSYIPKFASKLVPDGCKTVTELSESYKGESYTSYSISGYEDKFNCQLYSTLQQSKEACLTYFFQFIPVQQRKQACKRIYFKNIKLPKNVQDNHQFIYVGKMVSIKVNIFGKSIIETLVLKYFIKMYKTNFKNLFTDYAIWSQFSFEECDKLRSDQFKDFYQEEKDVESSSSKSSEFSLTEKQQEEFSTQIGTVGSYFSFDGKSM